MISIFVLARNAKWARRFIRGMGWDANAVSVVSSPVQLQGISKGLLFELAGWSDDYTLQDTNVMANELLRLKRSGLQIPFITAENLF